MMNGERERDATSVRYGRANGQRSYPCADTGNVPDGRAARDQRSLWPCERRSREQTENGVTRERSEP